jgi:hypothetical protein
MHPQNFFDDYVAPAVHEAQRNLLNIRLATVALCELDNMAEHWILFGTPTATRDDVAAQRTALGAGYPSLALARDIHDTHKHGRLTRKNATIKQGQRPTVQPMGGALGSFPLGAAPIGGVLDELMIELDDGQRHSVRMVIQDCVSYWRGVLGLS